MCSRSVLILIAIGYSAFADTPADPRVQDAEQFIAEGRIADAAIVYQTIYEEAKRSGAAEDRLANAAADFANMQLALDRYAGTEPLIQQALEIDRRLFGADAPRTAKHELILARLCTLQHREQQAQEILTRIRPILEQAYGAESKVVATLFNDQGLNEELMGRAVDAVIAYRSAIDIYEGLGDAGRKPAGIVMVNLSSVLLDQGLLLQAEVTAKESLGILRQRFGPEHPLTARAMNSLGRIYQTERRLDEARDMYERALEIWEKYPASGGLEAAALEGNLGAIYTDTGYYAKSEALLRKSLAEQEAALGPNAPELSGVLNNLGALYARQQRWMEAGRELERGLEIANRRGFPDTKTAPLMQNLAVVYFSNGRYRKDQYAKAEALFRRVLAIQEQRYGPDHIEVAGALMNLAQACAAEKNYREAKQLEGRAVAIRRTVLGPTHPETVEALHAYTLLLRKKD